MESNTKKTFIKTFQKMLSESKLDKQERLKLKTFLLEIMKSQETWNEFVCGVMGQATKEEMNQVTELDFNQFRQIVLNTL